MRTLLVLLTLTVASSACAQPPRATSTARTVPRVNDAAPIPPPRPRLPAAVRVTERTETYAIQGTTDRELLASIRRASPIRESGVDGRALDAYTRWRIGWQYRYQRNEGRCRFTAVTVDVDLTTTLWRWSPPRAADPDLVADWSRRALVLREHEEGHASYVLLGAREVFSALRPMQAPTCDALRDLADAKGQQILDGVRAANRRYDEITQHGTVPPPTH